METSGLPRHQIIESLLALSAEKGADASISLWEEMASQIISIVGEAGFNSLYARSIFLVQPTFPWLKVSPSLRQTGHRFVELKTSFEGQTPTQASAANSLLLITFTNILATLIGEALTVRLLRSAWAMKSSDNASKELKHE